MFAFKGSNNRSGIASTRGKATIRADHLSPAAASARLGTSASGITMSTGGGSSEPERSNRSLMSAQAGSSARLSGGGRATPNPFSATPTLSAPSPATAPSVHLPRKQFRAMAYGASV